MSISKKHVLCFIASLSGGGAERQMIELMKVLLERGYKVTLLTYTEHDDYQSPTGVNRINVTAKNKVDLLIKLILAIKRVKCDCCISFLHQNNFVSCLSTFPIKRFKLIVGERNLTLNASKLERVLYFLYRRADYIVPNSISQSDFIKSNAAWLSSKIKTITNYTDIDRNQPKFKMVDPNHIKVGVFARYIQQKNPLFLARIAYELRKKGYTNFTFHWHGNYQLNINNYAQVSLSYTALRDKIQEYSLNDSFFLHSFASDSVATMNEMDIICLPSFYEGYPNVISEGMACGKFIIASSVSDIPYIVEDGVNGFLFESNNLDSAVDAFSKYLTLPKEEINNICMRNRVKAENIFSRELFADNYINLIESVE